MSCVKMINRNGSIVVVDEHNAVVRNRAEFYCLSTDPKPANADNMDFLMEADTGKIFLYNADADEWLPLFPNS